MSQSILLFTEDIQKARREIDDLEGQITQQFTDSVFVANLPDSVDPQSLSESTPDLPSTLDPVSQLAADAWEGLQSKTFSAAAPSDTEGLSWDTPGFTPPNPPHDEEPDGSPEAPEDGPFLSTGTPTSLYMTGSVAVGVVIVSGTQSGLAFTNSEQLKVIQEVQEGLDFLANAEPLANLSFEYDIRLITVSAAPGPTTSYEAAEGPWRNAALQDMGYPPARSSSRQYVQDLRTARGTDWVFVAYFTKYPLRHFAYAVSEKTVMHYDNDGWGVDSISKVFAHEACHIFGAADEYGSCTCGGSHGFLGIPNNNCTNCPGTQESCLMDGNVLQLCEWSRGQIGWHPSILEPNHPPVLEYIAPIVVDENSRVDRTIRASDPDGHAVHFELTWRPGFVSLIDNGNGTAELVAEPGFEDSGNYWALVKVTDSEGAFDTQYVSIMVRNVNRPPVLANIGPIVIREGSRLARTIRATDPDRQVVAFTATGLPRFATFNDEGGGAGRLTLRPGYKDAGLYHTTLTITDPDGASDSESFSIRVRNVLQPLLTHIDERPFERNQGVIELKVNNLLPNLASQVQIQNGASWDNITNADGNRAWFQENLVAGEVVRYGYGSNAVGGIYRWVIYDKAEGLGQGWAVSDQFSISEMGKHITVEVTLPGG
jgi:hypothetical protein